MLLLFLTNTVGSRLPPELLRITSRRKDVGRGSPRMTKAAASRLRREDISTNMSPRGRHICMHTPDRGEAPGNGFQGMVPVN